MILSYRGKIYRIGLQFFKNYFSLFFKIFFNGYFTIICIVCFLLKMKVFTNTYYF